MLSPPRETRSSYKSRAATPRAESASFSAHPLNNSLLDTVGEGKQLEETEALQLHTRAYSYSTPITSRSEYAHQMRQLRNELGSSLQLAKKHRENLESLYNEATDIVDDCKGIFTNEPRRAP